MTIKIIASRLSTPDVEGYPDKVSFVDADTGTILKSFSRFGTNPNPVHPGTLAKWQTVYAQIALGTYNYACFNSPKHGKCLMLNGLAAIPTTLPNMNPQTANPGMNTAEDVEVHCGFSDGWRGSEACQTVFPEDWPDFVGYFAMGDTGIYILQQG